jgi:hypothetical protein
MSEEKKELVIYKNSNLDLKDIQANCELMVSVMKSVMIEGTHYGTIPGTGKKEKIDGVWTERNNHSLWKPGAEKIMSTFRIGTRLDICDLSTEDEARYRVKAIAFHTPTGNELGEAFGECSSFESKYKWEQAVCEEQYDETPSNKRRKKWEKPKYGPKKGVTSSILQVQTEKADKANTILKMAEKRAVIGVVLKVTAASDVFGQSESDVLNGELPKDVAGDHPKDVTPPQAITEISLCSKCSQDIKENVRSFSQSKFGAALCMDCQKEAST